MPVLRKVTDRLPSLYPRPRPPLEFPMSRVITSFITLDLSEGGNAANGLRKPLVRSRNQAYNRRIDV
jgi:hypothetical protein